MVLFSVGIVIFFLVGKKSESGRAGEHETRPTAMLTTVRMAKTVPFLLPFRPPFLLRRLRLQTQRAKGPRKMETRNQQVRK